MSHISAINLIMFRFDNDAKRNNESAETQIYFESYYCVGPLQQNISIGMFLYAIILNHNDI